LKGTRPKTPTEEGRKKGLSLPRATTAKDSKRESIRKKKGRRPIKRGGVIIQKKLTCREKWPWSEKSHQRTACSKSSWQKRGCGPKGKGGEQSRGKNAGKKRAGGSQPERGASTTGQQKAGCAAGKKKTHRVGAALRKPRRKKTGAQGSLATKKGDSNHKLRNDEAHLLGGKEYS